jgi:hypothetical protein
MRFEQYWKLIDTCEDSPKIGKQTIALLRLKNFSDYKDETVEYLSACVARNDPWTIQNINTIQQMLGHFGQPPKALAKQ